jgi:hypothetical protein
MGDALMQWPLAYAYWKETGNQFDVLLDMSINKLAPIFQEQPCVGKLMVEARCLNWSLGGQPWNMGVKPNDISRYAHVYHMGFRELPTYPITMFCKQYIPVEADEIALSKQQSLALGEKKVENYCVVHATSRTHMPKCMPMVWPVYLANERYLSSRFDNIYFIGNDDDKVLYETMGPRHGEWFDDMGELRRSAELVQNAAFVLSAGSMFSPMAACFRTPCLRVHDTIAVPAEPKTWCCVGEDQMNWVVNDLLQMTVIPEFVEEHCLSR